MIDRILALAQGEIGVRESPPNSNNVKYNTEYYARAINHPNYAWCAVFIWWLMKQCGMQTLYYGGGKTAYCPTLLADYKKRGWCVTEKFQKGDIVFFNFQGGKNPAHVGICESYDGNFITTIDGNTSAGNQANGGAVLRQKRAKKYIVAVARPPYQTQKQEEEMTQQQFNQMMDSYLSNRAAKKPDVWSEKARVWAEKKGIIAGTGEGEKQYKNFCTREELVQILFRIFEG